MSPQTTTPDALLSNAFQQHNNHALTVLEDGKVVGVLQMRDVLSAYVQFGQINDLRVSDHMVEDVITIENANNSLQVARKFANHKIKSLVVAKKGIFSHFLDPQEAITLLPSSLPGFFQPSSQNMIVNPYTTASDTTVHDAITTMARCRISCLPVVDEGGKILGMFSESDAVHCVSNDNCSALISDIMTAPALTCPSNASLRQSWDLMQETQVMKLLMVRDDGKFHGLLTVTDVLVGLCRSFLSVFHAYHCPKDADMMLELHNGGMIMDTSAQMHTRLGYAMEELIGLRWQGGCHDNDVAALLKLKKGKPHHFIWQMNGSSFHFVATRNTETSVMFWQLEETSSL